MLRGLRVSVSPRLGVEQPSSERRVVMISPPPHNPRTFLNGFGGPEQDSHVQTSHPIGGLETVIPFHFAMTPREEHHLSGTSTEIQWFEGVHLKTVEWSVSTPILPALTRQEGGCRMG